MDTWKVIVEAGKIRSYAPALKLSESKSLPNESNGLPPDICYHRQCYQIFTMKNLLKRIKKKSQDQTADEKKDQEELKSLIDRLQSYLTDTVMLRNSSAISTCSSAGSSILPDICIICDKKNKYVKKKQEPLRQCVVKQTQKRLEKFANERNDFRMQSLVTTSDMTAAKAKYHPSCYAEYTCPKNKKQTQSPEVTEYKHYELEAFQSVVASCRETICKQTILKLQNLTAIMKDHLHKNGLEITSSTKKNLRRNIEKTFGNDIKFINVNHNVLLYPQSMTVETAILELCKENEEEKMISKVASIIRKEVKDLKNELPWPPQRTDLAPSIFLKC